MTKTTFSKKRTTNEGHDRWTVLRDGKPMSILQRSNVVLATDQPFNMVSCTWTVMGVPPAKWSYKLSSTVGPKFLDARWVVLSTCRG